MILSPARRESFTKINSQNFLYKPSPFNWNSAAFVCLAENPFITYYTIQYASNSLQGLYTITLYKFFDFVYYLSIDNQSH